MISQAKLLRTIRRVTLGVALIGGVYIVMRYNVTEVPEGRCSSIVRFVPGARLVIDGSPRALAAGDAVLVKDSNGGLHLTLIGKVRGDGRLWCETDSEDCPGFTSEAYGWISREAITGRVLLSWGP